MMMIEGAPDAGANEVTDHIQAPKSTRVNADPVHNLCVNGG
jgi:hypothetical protein